MVIERLYHHTLGAVGQGPVECVHLPALVHPRELETAIGRVRSLLRLRHHHPAPGEQPRQCGRRRGSDSALTQLVSHRDRAVVPAVLGQLLADLDRQLLDQWRDRQRRAIQLPTSRGHRGERALLTGPPPQRIEPGPRDLALGAEPDHSATRSILGPGRDHQLHVHRNRPDCHGHTVRPRPGQVSGRTRDRTVRSDHNPEQPSCAAHRVRHGPQRKRLPPARAPVSSNRVCVRILVRRARHTAVRRPP